MTTTTPLCVIESALNNHANGSEILSSHLVSRVPNGRGEFVCYDIEFLNARGAILMGLCLEDDDRHEIASVQLTMNLVRFRANETKLLRYPSDIPEIVRFIDMEPCPPTWFASHLPLGRRTIVPYTGESTAQAIFDAIDGVYRDYRGFHFVLVDGEDGACKDQVLALFGGGPRKAPMCVCAPKGLCADAPVFVPSC